MARPGKYQLSLSQLAEFDDLLTDALVDRVYYWTKIRKMKHSYHPNRGIKTEEVVKIIVHEVVRNKNTAGALQRFLELNGVKQYLNKVSNKSPNAEADFIKHARRYLSMYSPDAGFEVSSTNRYNPLSPEASIISRRPFRRGDTIKYLTGAMVRMSSAEEDAFTHGATDFSIIYSSRVGGMSLLLGPARFVNHDCEPNAKFVTTNKDNVTLVVERDVDVGEEVTVKYADDYFGEGNKECLCRTCEVQMRNGWAGDVVSGAEDEEEIDIDSLVPGAIITRRSSRKRLSYGTPVGVEETLEQVEKRNRSKRKSVLPTLPNQILSPPDSSRGMSVETGIGNSLSATPSVIGGPEEIVNAHTPAPDGLDEQEQEQTRPMTPPKTNGTGTPAVVATAEGTQETVAPGEPLSALPEVIVDGLSALEQAIKAEETPAKEEVEGTEKQRDTVMENAGPVDADSPATTIPDSTPGALEDEALGPEGLGITSASVAEIAKSFGLSAPLSALSVNVVPASNLEPIILEDDEELSDFTDIDDDEIDDSILAILLPKKTHKKKSGNGKKSKIQKKPSITTMAPRRNSLVSTTTPVLPGIIEPPRTRVPGDYLSWHLNTEGTKCVCSDCQKTFVHDDRWYVPRACKRCERHSKIYGLVWPKTVKRKNDSEEQIDDHRLIQRYVTASEHRKEQKKLEEESALAENIRAKRRSSYNPKDSYTVPISSRVGGRSSLAGTRKRKRGDVDVEQEMEDIDGVFDALKRVGRGGKRSKLEAEVIR